jgi:hypothetical protein
MSAAVGEQEGGVTTSYGWQHRDTTHHGHRGVPATNTVSKRGGGGRCVCQVQRQHLQVAMRASKCEGGRVKAHAGIKGEGGRGTPLTYMQLEDTGVLGR